MAHHTAANGTGIPLHCNICPKKPNFSDTSHLLTHVASKQHLSNYFKLRVRVATDPAAQRDVDDYDRWYQDWNLDDLMRERMNQKERRTKGASAGGAKRASAATPQISSSRSGSVPMSMPLPRRQASLRNNLLDPQLGPKIKTEPNSRPSTPGLLPNYDPLEGNRSYTAPMHGWGSMPYNPSPSLAGISNTNSYASDADDDDDDASSYGYAPTRIPRRRKMSDETNSWQSSMSGSFTGSAYLGEEQDPMDAPSDMARLKGDIWPGMDIFDSATPEMRRKRNQKKATSVIVQLQATSEIVTPTELIFDNLGEFKKERVISGEPNSADSPLRGETTPEPDEPPVKKRTARRRPRTALADKDPNGGRSLRSNRRTGSHHPGAKSLPQYIDGSDDLDEDDFMTYGQRRAAPRRSGLSIHRDNTGPDITFDRPATMSCLTSSFPEPFPDSRSNGPSMQSAFGRSNSQPINDGYYQQTATQQASRNQPRAFTAGFRASDTNPQPQRDLSAFGGLTNQPIYQASHIDFTTGQASRNGFPQIPHPFASNNITPTTASIFVQDNSLQMQNWDVFGLNTDAGFGPLDMNFNNVNDTMGANPLFIEGNTDMPDDDDEGTISAPVSDTSPS